MLTKTMPENIINENSLQITLKAVSQIWWRGMDLNHGPSGYAYHYSFRCHPTEVGV